MWQELCPACSDMLQAIYIMRHYLNHCFVFLSMCDLKCMLQLLPKPRGFSAQFVSLITNELRSMKFSQVLNLNRLHSSWEWGRSYEFVTEAQTGKMSTLFLSTIFDPCLVENLFSVKFLFLLAYHFLWIVNTQSWTHILDLSHWWFFECQSECQSFWKPSKKISLLSNLGVNLSFAACHRFHLQHYENYWEDILHSK